MSAKHRCLNFKTSSLLVVGLLLSLASKTLLVLACNALAMRGLIDVSAYVGLLEAVPLVSCVACGVGVALVCAVGVVSHFRFERSAFKFSRRKVLVVASLVFCGLIVFSCFASVDASVVNTISQGYKICTSQLGYSWVLDRLSNGDFLAMNGTDGNVLTFVEPWQSVAPWATYASNSTALTERVLASVTSGNVLVHNFGFDVDLLADIPADVLVVNQVGNRTYQYINTAASMGSPYTISVGSDVNAGYYLGADAGDRICWTSTNAKTTLQNAIDANTGKGTISINEGNFVGSGNLIIGNTMSVIGASQVGIDINDPTSNRIKAATTLTGFGITITGTGWDGLVAGVALKNLEINVSSGAALNLTYADKSSIEGVATNGGTYGLYLSGVVDSQFAMCDFTGAEYGNYACGDNAINQNNWLNCHYTYNTKSATFVSGFCAGNTWNGCLWQANDGDNNVYWYGTRSCSIIGNSYFEISGQSNSSFNDIFMDYAFGCQIQGNFFAAGVAGYLPQIGILVHHSDGSEISSNYFLDGYTSQYAVSVPNGDIGDYYSKVSVCNNYFQNATTGVNFKSNGECINNKCQYGTLAQINIYPSTTRDLMLYYPFDEGTGSTVTDWSGSGNAGNITGASYGIGKYNKALVTDGSQGQYAEIANLNVTGWSQATVCAWVKTNGQTHSWDTIFRQCDVGDTHAPLSFYMQDSKIILGIDNGTATVSRGSITTLSADTWYFVCGVYDGSVIHIYINGIEDVSPIAQTGALSVAQQSAYVSRYGTFAYDLGWNGRIDEMRVYNRALTSADVYQVFLDGALPHST